MQRQYSFCPMCGCEYHSDQKAGFVHLCSNCNFKFYENQNATASAIIFHQHKLLMVKRAIKPQPGKWDFPGGFINPDEQPVDAVLREIKEELGVNIKVINLFGVYAPTKYTYQQKDYYNCDLYFLSRLQDHHLTPKDDVQDFGWFSLDELPHDNEIAFSTQVKLVNDLRQQTNLWE